MLFYSRSLFKRKNDFRRNTQTSIYYVLFILFIFDGNFLLVLLSLAFHISHTYANQKKAQEYFLMVFHCSGKQENYSVNATGFFNKKKIVVDFWREK